MSKKLNEAEGIGQRVIMWNRATSDGFVPALCVVCEQVKSVKRSTALVWRSNKDAPACCARTAPHLVKRIRSLEIAIDSAKELLVDWLASRNPGVTLIRKAVETLANAKESGS